MKSKHTTAKFIIDCKHVTVNGVPELGGITGGLVGEEVASFLKDGHEWYLANIKTGRYRKLTSHCRVTVDDIDIDYEAIMKKCPNGLYNAETKSIRYSSVSFMMANLRMAFQPFHGCSTRMDNILLIVMALVWRIILRRKYMQLLIPILK